MYVMTREKTEEEIVKEVYISQPEFNIDDVRRIKALIRFKTGVVKNLEEKKLSVLMKYGRCISIGTINNALYNMTIRLSGKDRDDVYKFTTLYNNGKVDITVTNYYAIDKDTK